MSFNLPRWVSRRSLCISFVTRSRRIRLQMVSEEEGVVLPIMAFFKRGRDQLKANAFVSNLEFAKAGLSRNDTAAGEQHVRCAFEALQAIKEAKAGYIFSREAWLYAADLCFDLGGAFGVIGKHQLSHTCFFMHEWALWNEDQIGAGGALSKVRSVLSPGVEWDGKTEPQYKEDNAETRIASALENGGVDLALSELELTRLPESVARLTDLQNLVLCRNQLTSLPEWIGGLTNLESLDLSGNGFTNLPVSFDKLLRLKSLSICDAQLRTLPEIPSNLIGLEELYLYGNQFKNLPDFLGNLIGLRKLSLGCNQLTRLPDSLGKLVNLEELYVNDNRLTTLPESLKSLNSLNTLDVTGNPLIGSAKSFGILARLIEHQI